MTIKSHNQQAEERISELQVECNLLAVELERCREKLSRHEVEGGIPMPCGHPIQAAYVGDEGTGHCRWCEDMAEGGG